MGITAVAAASLYNEFKRIARRLIFPGMKAYRSAFKICSGMAGIKSVNMGIFQHAAVDKSLCASWMLLLRLLEYEFHIASQRV